MKGRPVGRPPRMGETMVMLAIRVTPALRTRIEAYAERLQSERPGSSVGVSDAARALLIEGLDRHRVR